MSTTLRQELRDMISGLHAHIQEDNRENIEIHRNRCQFSEISCMRLLLVFNQLALMSGNHMSEDENFMDCGQIRDCNDYVQIALKELSNYRKKAELFVEQTRDKIFPGDLHMSRVSHSSAEIFKQVLNQETNCTQQVEAEEKRHATALRKSLATCSETVCKLLVEALESSALETEIEKKKSIGKEAAENISRIIKEWLQWYLINEPKKASTPMIVLPQSIQLLTAADDDAAQFIKAFRKLMHINRQYHRLYGISSRIEACVTVVNVLNSLKARIILPT